MAQEKAKIFIVDKTYDDGNEDQRASEKFKTEIESKFQIHLVDANIGAGADLPSFLWDIIVELGEVFFLGEKINNNLEAWKEIGKKLERVVKVGGVYFNRMAAAIWAIYKANIQTKSIRLLSYKSYNRRQGEIDTGDKPCIDSDPKDENISDIEHVFLIEVDESRKIKFKVSGDNVEIEIQ